MRRMFAFIVVAFCTLVYIASATNSFTRRLQEKKLRTSGCFASDRYRYGDLYGMSYLSYFRKHQTLITDSAIEYYRNENLMDLYIVCDSYLWSYLEDKKFFFGAGKLTLIKTNAKETLLLPLDAAKNNVLLIEIAERNVRRLLQDTAYLYALIKPASEIGGSNSGYSARQQHQTFGGTLQRALSAAATVISSERMNENIESNLYDYSIFTPLKELKADVNYRLFGTTAKGVVISNKKPQLYLYETVDTIDLSGAFTPITKEEIDTAISRLNALYAAAKLAGFSQVYFSVIPNPVSVIEPGYNGFTYNHLAATIQRHPQLKLTAIDVTEQFSRMRDSVYGPAESHWNARGIRIWLQQFNTVLKERLDRRLTP